MPAKLRIQNIISTRMHSNRMRTARSLTVSRSICRQGCVYHTHPLPCVPPCCAPPFPCTPSAMHAPTLTTHAPLPATHAPLCHACPLPCMPPAIHAPLPHMAPLPCTPPHVTHTPLAMHIPPVDRQTPVKHNLHKLSLRAVTSKFKASDLHRLEHVLENFY